MTEPIDIESLDPLYRDVFRDPANGTPDDISKAGCLALAKLGAEAWNAWREVFPTIMGEDASSTNTAVFDCCDLGALQLDFSGFDFGDDANFSNSIFGFGVGFDGAKFGDGTKFIGARFGEGAVFDSARFGDDTNFSAAQFDYGASFDGAWFGDDVYFEGAQFCESASFKGVRFGTDVSFCANDWNELAWAFEHDGLLFKSSKEWAEKHGAHPKFFKEISFAGANFGGEVNFSGREFQGKTAFSALDIDIPGWRLNESSSEVEEYEYLTGSPVIFSRPPIFHGCKFHQDTSFDGAIFNNEKFPNLQHSGASAYRTLKVFFANQQATRQEQYFFKKEIAEEAQYAPFSQQWLYKAYYLCSDYGFSITRPAVLLAATLALMMLIYGILSYLNNCVPDSNACRFSTAWIEFSLLQSLPLPGLDKLSDTLRGQLFPTEGLISIGVTLAVILHKAISLLALFLMGLALRNLFKLK